MIEFTDVSVQFPAEHGHSTILHPFSLSLSEQRLSVIGANGSGKSTFARLINALITPATGRVLVNGLDATAQRARVRSEVGFIFTDPAAQLLMPRVIEDVELSLSQVRNKKERSAQALSILDRFGIAELAQRSIMDISGGQRQLLALASVLAVDPAIIVADEPSTLLDLKNTLLLREKFSQLPQQLIVTTHDLDLALDAQRTLVFDQGRIVFDGPSALAVSFYRELMMQAS